MACSSCGSNFCGCGTSTIAIPVVKGDKGDTGATGATGATGPAGAGVLNATKKLFGIYSYPTTTLVTISTTDLESAGMASIAYNVVTGLSENDIFTTYGPRISHLDIYAKYASADQWFKVSDYAQAQQHQWLNYISTEVEINFSTLVNLLPATIQALIGVDRGSVEFTVVIIG